MALAPDQVGFILDKLELLAFRTTFDPDKKTGLVPSQHFIDRSRPIHKVPGNYEGGV